MEPHAHAHAHIHKSYSNPPSPLPRLCGYSVCRLYTVSLWKNKQNLSVSFKIQQQVLCRTAFFSSFFVRKTNRTEGRNELSSSGEQWGSGGSGGICPCGWARCFSLVGAGDQTAAYHWSGRRWTSDRGCHVPQRNSRTGNREEEEE